MIDTHEKRDTNSKPRWEDVVAQKKKQQAEALAINIEPLPSSIAGSITALTSPDEITSKILSGQLTSHEIVRAFIQRYSSMRKTRIPCVKSHDNLIVSRAREAHEKVHPSHIAELRSLTILTYVPLFQTVDQLVCTVS
jgi:hypothetical protein